MNDRRCPYWPAEIMSGRDRDRTCDFCRVKGARPPHATVRHPALPHIRPAQRPCRAEAVWCCAWHCKASFLADCWQATGRASHDAEHHDGVVIGRNGIGSEPRTPHGDEAVAVWHASSEPRGVGAYSAAALLLPVRRRVSEACSWALAYGGVQGGKADGGGPCDGPC
jgi:hypothetical protein